MLTAVANESNIYEIVTELCEDAANVDIPIARESIRAVGKIALQQYDVNSIVDRLLQFLEMEKDHVTSEALVLVKDLLRKYPQWSQDCIAVVGNISSNNVQESKAKAALIWMLGEYSQEMHDAPYGLESLIENWDEEHSAEASTIQSISGRECGESSQTSTSATGQAPASIMAIDDLFGLDFFSWDCNRTATSPIDPQPESCTGFWHISAAMASTTHILIRGIFIKPSWNCILDNSPRHLPSSSPSPSIQRQNAHHHHHNPNLHHI
ncbi:unnamed protein product [Vicia faba]|uniref:Clathrin/coatomer adaptor adaptin-like N-terminal domain-containing protein n=1 Tax=Vicia faba TaxID=3906 RepID=A0AAV0Z5F3_VICFA|nr:unnamed protein product [Vicia faba]CAI8593042.1 unnamed protein product [Vicia faba]